MYDFTMNKSLIIVAAAITVATAQSAIAESTDAYCILTWHDSNKQAFRGPCVFREEYLNAFVEGFDYKFGFPVSHPSATFYKGSNPKILSFKREGHYTLKVYKENPSN